MRSSALFLLLLLTSSVHAVATDSIEKLADDFWSWRATYAPFSGDDVNRMERPGGIRDWSKAAIEKRRHDLAEFEARWKKINATSWPIPTQVDYKLIGSALSRVHWELDINPRWKRDPNFYLDQTLTALAEMARGGIRLDETTIGRIAEAEARRTRSGRIALWIGALALAVLAAVVAMGQR